MSYEVCSSEKLRESSADAEIKAMLYLLNFSEDSLEICNFDDRTDSNKNIKICSGEEGVIYGEI